MTNNVVVADDDFVDGSRRVKKCSARLRLIGTEEYNNDGDVVFGATTQCLFAQLVGNGSTTFGSLDLLDECDGLIDLDDIPQAIGGNQEEFVVGADFESSDFGIGNDAVLEIVVADRA
jgi:hypothetical protein